jgi:hypothetical protein
MEIEPSDRMRDCTVCLLKGAAARPLGVPARRFSHPMGDILIRRAEAVDLPRFGRTKSPAYKVARVSMDVPHVARTFSPGALSLRAAPTNESFASHPPVIPQRRVGGCEGAEGSGPPKVTIRPHAAGNNVHRDTFRHTDPSARSPPPTLRCGMTEIAIPFRVTPFVWRDPSDEACRGFHRASNV